MIAVVWVLPIVTCFAPSALKAEAKSTAHPSIEVALGDETDITTGW